MPVRREILQASPTGTMAGARSPRGKKRPAACMAESSGVRGAKVKASDTSVRAARPATTRTVSPGR